MGVDPATGKCKQQWVTVKGTKKEAEKRLAELLHQLDNGTLIKPGKTTVADYLNQWLKDYCWANLAPRTAEGYESIVRQHLTPALGNILLTQLKPEHLQRYYSEKLSNGRCDGNGGLSHRSVRCHPVTLHIALRTALRWGLISRNPADAVDPPHYQRTEMHVMDEDAIHILLEAAKSTPYYTAFYLALFTGVRRLELLALRWCDVDSILGQISVSRSLHHLHDKSLIFRAPKTARGRRTIALPPSAILVLKKHREKQETVRLILGTRLEESDLVFSQPDARPLLPDTVSHAWAKLTQRVGLKNIRLHDARHSHASPIDSF